MRDIVIAEIRDEVDLQKWLKLTRKDASIGLRFANSDLSLFLRAMELLRPVYVDISLATGAADMLLLLPDYSNLHTLIINEIGGYGAPIVSLPSSLKNLEICSPSQVTDDYLVSMTRGLQLSALRLSRLNELTERGILAVLERSDRLKKISLNSCDNIRASWVGGLRFCPQVEVIEVCRLPGEYTDELFASSTADQLRTLTLRSLRLAKGMLTGLRKAASLFELNLESTGDITADEWQTISALGHIEQLQVKRMRLIPQVFDALISLTSLTSVSLSGCIGAVSPAIAAVASLPRLQHLDISFVPNAEIPHDALSRMSLARLNASQCDISAKELRQVLNQAQMMRILEVSGNSRVDDAALIPLKTCRDLQELDLSGTAVNGSFGLGADYVRNLRVIRLTSCVNVTTREISWLASASALESLNLGYCSRVTPDVIGVLLNLEKLKVVWLPFDYGSACRHIEKPTLEKWVNGRIVYFDYN